MPAARQILACERGVAAIELAFGLSAFLVLIFGIINVSIMLWTLGSLHYAAETAARCASVDPTDCGTDAATQTYALNHYYGQPLGSNPFVSSAGGCGHTVAASYRYSLIVPLVGTYAVPLSTTACFP